MARDTKKYVYYTVGILRDSPLHRDLLQEAEELGKKQVPLIIAVWLKQYRQLRRSERIPLHQMPASLPDKNGVVEEFHIDLSNAEEADNAFPE